MERVEWECKKKNNEIYANIFYLQLLKIFFIFRIREKYNFNSNMISKLSYYTVFL